MGVAFMRNLREKARDIANHPHRQDFMAVLYPDPNND